MTPETPIIEPLIENFKNNARSVSMPATNNNKMDAIVAIAYNSEETGRLP